MAKVKPFALLGLVLFIVVIFLPGFAKMQELRSRNNALTKEIKKLQLYNAKLREEKFKLENDLGYVEKIAREKLGMVKENEIVYKIIPQDNKNNAK